MAGVTAIYSTAVVGLFFNTIMVLPASASFGNIKSVAPTL